MRSPRVEGIREMDENILFEEITDGQRRKRKIGDRIESRRTRNRRYFRKILNCPKLEAGSFGNDFSRLDTAISRSE